MPAWGDILSELSRPENTLPNGQPYHDKVRREYLVRLFQKTGRPTIVYSTGFLDKDYSSTDLSIELGDLQGFMNAVADLEGEELDLIVTSPGGSAEATESIIGYLRTRFNHIRAFVPVAAMSAATMLVLGCDEIVMGAHSQLGPIDPQFTIFTPDGPRSAPGQAILDQFERAKEECRAEPGNVAAWMPILRAYLPGLLAMCHDQREVAKRMVRDWLEQYMQDAVLSVHHCYSLTHSGTIAAKIIENHLGKAYVKIVGEVLVRAAPPAGLRPQAPQQPVAPNRGERRRQEREEKRR